jgi:hypothetical protein
MLSGRWLCHSVANRIEEWSFTVNRSSWLSWPNSRTDARPGQRRNPASRQNKARLVLESLEGRALLTAYTASSLSVLVADISAANTAGGANTITLAAPTTSPYVLTAVNNSTNGATGRPVIAANDNLTIVGNGDTIERSTASLTPDFRLIQVAGGGSLTLQNLTLQGGYGASGYSGGAIFSAGTLVLNDVTVQDNDTWWGGGGICSDGGSVTLAGGTIVQNNVAIANAWAGEDGFGGYIGGPGGGLWALGGWTTMVL